MKKREIIPKITFISLILIICIISYIAYSFPNLFQICFHLSNIIASLLVVNLIAIYSLSHARPQEPPQISPQISIQRFLIIILTASATIIAILVIYVGIIGYFLWHYPLSSFSEPFDCFIAIWGIATLTFSTITLFYFTFKRTLILLLQEL
jgi:hypothetical protein